MIKNSRLIFSMSLPERIKLITGVTEYKSRSMDAYSFPIMDIVCDPAASKGVRATDFPSDTALECAFDSALTKKVYECIGNETKANALNAYYDVQNDLNCGEPFFKACFAAGKAAGLNRSGTFVNYNDFLRGGDTADERIASRLFSDVVMRGSDPDSVTVRTAEQADRFAEYRGGGLMFGVASSKEEVARYLYSGYSFVFLESDFTEELVPYLTVLTAEYRKAAEACARGKITPEKIEICCRELAMLSEDRINEACDSVVERLRKLGELGPDSVCERRISLDGGAASFNEPYHDNVALEAARRSAVLVKNNGMLPLAHERKAAVLGEYAKNKAYHDNGNTPTSPYLPFEVINDFEIETVGFAYGYRSGEPMSTDLWNTARRLCAKADVALVYLCAGVGECVLPTEQLELVNALRDNGTKTVAIVASDGIIDMGFADKCDAVILTHRGGQKAAHAVFEIITGFTNPSGRLPYSVPMRIEADGTPSGHVRYPLGYGLSYTDFSFDKLDVTDAGVSFTAYNSGDRDGYATALLYIKKKASDKSPDGEKLLRGFVTVFVKKHGAEKVKIPFGEETFRTYDFSKGKYVVEGGDYVVSVVESQRQEALTGEICVRSYVFEDERHLSTEVERGTDYARAVREFTDTEDKRAFFTRSHTAPFGLRIAVAVMLALYFDIAAALLIVGRMLPESVLSYIILGVVIALVNILAAVYSATAVKRHRVLESRNEPITDDTIAKLGNFHELASVSYEKPVPQEEEDEKEPDEQEPPETVEEVPVYSFDTGFAESVRQDITFRNGISLPEICRNFHDYMLGWGIEVAPSSVRALFSAIASSKIIFVQINHKDILPNFLLALGNYFQGADVVDVSPNWKTPSDLFWSFNGDKYVASGFVNSVYAAAATPDKNAISILNHVNVSAVRDWFGDIIRFALFPSEKHILKLNDTTQVELPHNLCYLLFTETDDGELPAELAAASMKIHIGVSNAETPGEPVEIKPVSRKAFDDLVSEAREEYYLSEVVWKKLDELAETIGEKERFGFGNKIVLQMERFSSVLLGCGADESEAFTKTFTAKITEMLKTLSAYKEDKGDKVLFDLVEKLFGDENLTKIRKSLMKVSGANKKTEDVPN